MHVTAGRVQASCASRVEDVLARIGDKASQGGEIYTFVDADAARASAWAADARAQRGQRLSAVDGVLVSLKASMDLAGCVTTAGSPRLAMRAPAAADALLVQRLRRGGAVVVGKTQMTELAYSGLGLNPHERLLRNPRDLARVTGGSSSGCAASVAAGLAELSIGGDTGGSVRIPAALCGLVGFKPSHGRVPAEGVFPLSTTLDCNGPMAATVEECAAAFAVLADLPEPEPGSAAWAGTVTPVAGRPMRHLDAAVRTAFDDAVSWLAVLGLVGPTLDLDAMFSATAELDRIGVFTVPELQASLADAGVHSLDGLDEMVRQRLLLHAQMPAAAYVRITRRRAQLIDAMNRTLQPGAIFMMPTVPVVAPRIAELDTVERQLACAALLVENTRLANLLDLPSITLPLKTPGLPVGLMLTARQGEDAQLLAAARVIEAALA